MGERARYELFLSLESVLGPEHAQTFMQTIPPGGWPDMLTRQDLDTFEQHVGLRFDAMERRFKAMEYRCETREGKLVGASVGGLVTAWTAEMKEITRAQTRTLMLVNLGAVLSTATLAFAAAKLA
jgi:hypothetical protein